MRVLGKRSYIALVQKTDHREGKRGKYNPFEDVNNRRVLSRFLA